MTTTLLACLLFLAPLQARLEAIAASFQGQVAMFAKNLKTGETAGLHLDQRVRTASVIKVPILVETFYQIKEGKLRLDQKARAQGKDRVGGAGILSELNPELDITLEDALKLMIEMSDNSATNVVLNLVTPEAVTARMASLGLTHTKSFKKIFQAAEHPSAEVDEFGIGVTTPEEMGRLLEMIERGQAVDAASSAKMLAYLKKQQDWNNMPRELAGQKVEFAMKSGALDDLRNDVGIIYTQAGPIVVAFFCDRSPDQRWSPDNAASVTIGKLARAVYDAWAGPAATPFYDLVIAHAHVVDGSGNPWFPADVAIRNGRIARVARYGSLSSDSARRYIDAANRVVAPGFTDVHVHVEDGLVRLPTADNFVMDGVTSLVTGNCGGSRTDLGEYFAKLEKTGISPNVASLIGHNSVRAKVMGTANRQATPEEVEAMRRLVEQNIREGAIGFSTGLIYIPGTYANTQEVVDLAKAAAELGGVYASHIRNEGRSPNGSVFDAIREAIHVGEEAKMPVEISHFKVANKSLWGQSNRTLELVEEARRHGQEVTVDEYPYRASSTTMSSMIPSWALADGDEQVRQRLADPATHKKVADEMFEEQRKTRKNLDYAVVSRAKFDPSIEGKNITEITRMHKRKPTLRDDVETVLSLEQKRIEAKNEGIQMIFFSMSDEDVERIMRAPFTMFASDGGITEFNVGMPHPRAYATNSRALAYYVREKRNLTLEDAIRKMTSLPAQTFRLKDRGLLREGYWADVVVFDPDKVQDKATYQQPHQYSAGFDWVLVNGEPVVADGKQTSARPGRILYGPARSE